MASNSDDPYGEEAERLATLPICDQKAVLDIYRGCAENPKLSPRQRQWNRLRVAALERHLRRLNKRKKPD